MKSSSFVSANKGINEILDFSLGESKLNNITDQGSGSSGRGGINGNSGTGGGSNDSSVNSPNTSPINTLNGSFISLLGNSL